MNLYNFTSAFALFALTVAPSAKAGALNCSFSPSRGTQIALHIEEKGAAFIGFSMDFAQEINSSPHDCSIGARRGDGHSRWSGGKGATYITIRDSDAGRLEASAQRYRGEVQLSVSAPEGEPAICGVFAVPVTILVTPKPNGRCVARLPNGR